MLENEWIQIPGATVIYWVRHRIMEGDCQVDHGPFPITVPPFLIQRYPVTNGQFLRFVEETGYVSPGGTNFLQHLRGGLTKENENLPVTFVSHADAESYARWLGGALPTEVQWQYAAEGSTEQIWPWGDAMDAARLNGDSDTLTPVDAFPAGESPFGVRDLCGNAWEWTRDIADDGMHRFALLRGGCHYRGEHFWHFAGGPHPIHSHEKFPLFAGNFNRAATVSFRCVKEVTAHE